MPFSERPAALFTTVGFPDPSRAIRTAMTYVVGAGEAARPTASPAPPSPCGHPGQLNTYSVLARIDKGVHHSKY